MSDTVARIKDLTANARGTWLSLLGVLLFVGVTLMGVTDADFYAVNRATELPLIGVSVPTDLFFFTAPVLVAAVYIYFHLYLIRLVDALAVADPRVESGQRLSDAVSPWLLTDAALFVRSRARKDNSRTPRVLDWPAMVVNFNLSWGFGPLVLGFAVYQSLPARDWLMTGIASGSLFLASVTGFVSLYALNARMRQREFVPARRFWLNWAVVSFTLASAAGLAWYTSATTTGSGPWLAPINLREANLTEKPEGWLPYTIARKEFAEDWCKRSRLRAQERAGCSDPDVTMPASFDQEWSQRRDAALVALSSPVHQNHSFRGLGTPPPDRDFGTIDTCDRSAADLTAAFLPRANLEQANFTCANLDEANLEGAILTNAILNGTDLVRAEMQGADLFEAEMQGANLIRAQMQGANLREAQMQGATLGGAQMQGADLFAAQMQGADLFEAKMQGADLVEAQMQGANLRAAKMQGADLFEAEMQGANLFTAQMQGANLIAAKMQGANLIAAQMQGADLSLSALIWGKDSTGNLIDSNLSASTNNGGALRFVDLRIAAFDAETNWRNAFLDGSVTLHPDLIETHTVDGALPCQWETQTLTDDTAFYGRWRWWIEKRGVVPWQEAAPDGWQDVPVNPGPDDCAWKPLSR